MGYVTAFIGLLSAWYSLLPRVSLLIGPVSEGSYVFRTTLSVSNDTSFALKMFG